MIARKAGVDPAMIRYYFASREELLFRGHREHPDVRGRPHPPPKANPAEQLAMLDSRHGRFRSQGALDAAADDRGSGRGEIAGVRKRVRELNTHGRRGYAKYLTRANRTRSCPPTRCCSTSPSSAWRNSSSRAQPMILPLLPEKTSADELAERYKAFIVKWC